MAYGFVWTLDTVTTLGALKDPQDAAGRVVVVLLELFGIGTLFYGLATVAEFFVSGQLSGLREERRNQRMIDSYSDHFIICGFGRVGRQVARDLSLAAVKHVAIDANPSHREEAAELGVRYIESYAADDEVLISAGIMRARAVDGLRGLRRRQHLHRPHRARVCARTSSSSPGPRPRTPSASSSAPARTA